MKKEEGKAFDLNTEETTQKVLEVGTSTNETKIDDKTSFENFKVLYDGRIKEKCLADYGTVEDKELLEDTAKELYLTSQELIPDEDTKSEGDLEEEKTKQEESVKLTERAFKSGRTKTEAISNESKFLAHILNGVISDVQNKFNVTATGELDTGNKNKVVVTLKGSTLDLIDATSYLAKAIRRDDVDFTFDDEIKNNTVRCVISPKDKVQESEEDDTQPIEDEIEQIQQRVKAINRQLAYIRRRDAVSLSIGSENEKSDLYSERGKLNARLKKLKNKKTESKDNEGSEYDYMLLSRLKSDCDYFLGNGNRYEKHLWAGNIDDQIAKMKELYNKLPEKPEWLTMEDIENYEKEMKQDKKMESKFDKSQAVLSLDNYHSMGIIVSDDGSTVQYMYSNDEDSVYESDIEYDEEGRPYFKDEEGETWYIDEFMKTTFSESKEVKKESRDRVAERLPKFVYDLTKADFDKYGETAWSANGPRKDANGRTIYEVYRNGKSDFKIADIVAEIQKEFPELKLSLQSTAPGDRVFFVKETKKQESQSTEVGYNEFTEDMEEIERTINFIKEPKNKDAKEVLDDVKEFLNKLWADKEQNTFGIKYAENKKIEESIKDKNTETQNDILDYMLAECDFKVYSDGKAEVTYIPDLDDVQRYVYEDATQEDVDKVSKQLEDLITNARFYKEDGELYIQLNDNRTLYDIDNDNVDEQLYNDLLEPYFDAFEEDTGVQLYQAGRSGRHIVVKFNLENLENYDALKAEQEKQEQAFIEEVNNYGKEEESKDVEEPSTNKIDNIVAQLMEELPDFAQGYRDIIMELGLSKEDFIDMITTENEHQLLKDKNITEDEEKEVYGKIYDTLV